MSSPTPAVVAAAPESAPVHWNTAQKFAFRFAFVYWLIYCFGATLISDIPPIGQAFQTVDRALVMWFGSHVLHLNLSLIASGSGDSTYSYVELLCYFLVALVAACVWSIADRRRAEYATLNELLRIYVRYALGLTLFSYGMVKIFKAQFPSPDIDVLTETYGESSPMRLMWTFMGYSTPYTVFAGLSEVLPALLLFFRRTTMAGAMIAAAVMANVVIMNFSYDVPVKLFSSHLLVMSLFLLIPDRRRLADFMLFGRSVKTRNIAWPWNGIRWAKIGRRIVKPLYIAAGVFLISSNAVSSWHAWGDHAAMPPLYGIWRVEGDSSWQRVFVNAHQQFHIERANESRLRFRFQDDGKGGLALSWGSESYKLTYQKIDPDHLHLTGSFQGRPLDCRLARIPSGSFLLLNRGFHWINETPFNR